MNLKAWLGEEEFDLEIRREPDGAYCVTLGGEPRRVEVSEPENDILSLLIEGGSYEAAIRSNGEATNVGLAGRTYPVRVEDAALSLGGVKTGISGVQVIRSVMAGKVVDVMVSEGDVVPAGTPLLVIEAMKMENEIRAPKDGTVRTVSVRAGETVELGAELVTVE